MSKDTDLAWAAGFIDGEGTITLSKLGRTYVVLVEATNTNIAAVEHLRLLFGGKVVIHNKGNDKHSPSYKWRIFSAKAVEIILQIAPYLRIKHEQAKVAVIFQMTVKERHEWGNRGIDSDTRVLREACNTQMKSLNRRGPVRSY